MYFKYENLELEYDPFPVGLIAPLMDDDAYNQFVSSYPPLELFKELPKFGHKYSLSEKYNPGAYHEFIRTHKQWSEFHAWVKSSQFIYGLLAELKSRYIDLGYADKPLPEIKRIMKACKGIVAGQLSRKASRLRSRFEFSMLPANGGYVLPHVDNADKIVTIVVSMVREGEWKLEYGGGTDINYAKNIQFKFNPQNHQAVFDDVGVRSTYEFLPNQAMVFTPTFNSWHSVRPLTGPKGMLMRKTLTIVVEAL